MKVKDLKALIANADDEATVLVAGFETQLAERAAGEVGIVERPAEELPNRPEMTASWLRLSRAIDVVPSASALDLSKAAVELQAAKTAYEQQSSIDSIVSLASVEVLSHKPD